MTLEQQPVERPDIELRFQSPRIYLPDEFDKKLIADPAFKATIAGCTTLPLAWLRRDNDNHFSVDTYGVNEDPPTGHVNLEVHQDIKLTLLTGQKQVLANLFTMIHLDRNGMAFITSAVDLYRQQIGGQLDQDYGFGFMINNELMVLTAAYHQERIRDVDTLMGETVRRLNSHNRRSVDEMKEDVHDAFPSDQAFFLFLDQLKDRRGVQVFYGGRQELLEFIQSQKFVHIDDIGIELYQPIPDRLIVAVLPLGKYEQAELI